MNFNLINILLLYIIIFRRRYIFMVDSFILAKEWFASFLSRYSILLATFLASAPVRSSLK